mmetsp:Transcript_30893/g.67665  ORF Transcript_30893/g.67665 Transcript_30893/m.67665 type:complete len:502 (+) Transcript_30893:306-1811(+)
MCAEKLRIEISFYPADLGKMASSSEDFALPSPPSNCFSFGCLFNPSATSLQSDQSLCYVLGLGDLVPRKGRPIIAVAACHSDCLRPVLRASNVVEPRAPVIHRHQPWARDCLPVPRVRVRRGFEYGRIAHRPRYAVGRRGHPDCMHARAVLGFEKHYPAAGLGVGHHAPRRHSARHEPRDRAGLLPPFIPLLLSGAVCSQAVWLVLPFDAVGAGGEANAELARRLVEGVIVHVPLARRVLDLHNLRPSDESLALLRLEHGAGRVLALDAAPVHAVVRQREADAHVGADGRRRALRERNLVPVAAKVKHPVEPKAVLHHSRGHDVDITDADVRRVEPPPVLGVRPEDRAAALVAHEPIPADPILGLREADTARRDWDYRIIEIRRARRVPHHPAVAHHLVGEAADNERAKRFVVEPAGGRRFHRAEGNWSACSRESLTRAISTRRKEESSSCTHPGLLAESLLSSSWNANVVDVPAGHMHGCQEECHHVSATEMQMHPTHRK